MSCVQMRSAAYHANNSASFNTAGELLPIIMAAMYLSKYLEKQVQVPLGIAQGTGTCLLSVFACEGSVVWQRLRDPCW